MRLTPQQEMRALHEIKERSERLFNALNFGAQYDKRFLAKQIKDDYNILKYIARLRAPHLIPHINRMETNTIGNLFGQVKDHELLKEHHLFQLNFSANKNMFDNINFLNYLGRR